MVARHLRSSDHPNRRALVINAVDSAVTGLVCVLLCVEKFFAGAWLLLITLPCLIVLIRKINKHYLAMQKQLAIAKDTYRPQPFDHTVLVLVAAVNKPVLHALEYAKSISSRVEAVHVSLNPAATEELKQSWSQWDSGVPLVVLDSPFRSVSGPLLKYIDEVEDRYDHDIVTVVVPEFVTGTWWHNLLHNQTALAIKAMLMFRPGKVVTTVRYHLKD